MTRQSSRKPQERPQPLGRVTSQPPPIASHAVDLSGLRRRSTVSDFYPDADADKRAMQRLDAYLRSGRDKDAWLWAYDDND